MVNLIQIYLRRRSCDTADSSEDARPDSRTNPSRRPKEEFLRSMLEDASRCGRAQSEEKRRVSNGFECSMRLYESSTAPTRSNVICFSGKILAARIIMRTSVENMHASSQTHAMKRTVNGEYSYLIAYKFGVIVVTTTHN